MTDSVLTSRTPRGLLEEKASENDFIVRNNAATIIGNGVISLLWQLRCHCNPDHDNFSSISNTTVVAIFPNVSSWRRSLCSNLAGIDPEKLYRGTFICQYGLCCCMVWPSFLFVWFVKIWATCKNFLGKLFTAPWPKIARTPMCFLPSPHVFCHSRPLRDTVLEPGTG